MRIYISLLLFATLSACSGFSRYRVILDHAEGMIERNCADSACRVLAPIHLQDLRSVKLKARFALLYSQALDKNYIDLKDDSLASVAVDYYATKGSAYDRAKSYYYLGRICENMGDIESCIINFTKASESLPENNYDHLRGLIYSHIGDLYYKQLQYEKSIYMHGIAIDAFAKCGANANEAITAYKISQSCHLLNQYDSADIYIHRALNISLSNQDYSSALIYLKSIEMLEVEQGKLYGDAIKQLYCNYDKYNGGIIPTSDYFYLSNLYRQDNNIDSAIYFLQQYKHSIKEVSIQDRLAITNFLHRLSEQQSDYKQAHDYAKTEMLYIDTINIMREKHLIETVTEKYKSQLYKSKIEDEKAQAKRARYLMLLLLVASLNLSYIIFIRYKRRVEKINQDVNTANDLIDSLTSSYSILAQQYEMIKSKSNDKEVETIAAVMEQFNNLIEKIPECDKRPRKFIDEFISLVRTSKISDTNTFIYNTVNNQYYGAVDRLKAERVLSQSEAETLCMISMGFSNSAMSIAFDHTTSKTVYNYKSSLKSKLGVAMSQNTVAQLLKSI